MPIGTTISADQFEKKYGNKGRTLSEQEFNRLYGASGQVRATFGTRTRRPGVVERVARTLSPKSVEGFADTLGGALAGVGDIGGVKSARESQSKLDDLNKQLVEAIKKGRERGEDTSRIETRLTDNLGPGVNIEELIPATTKTTKEIAGEALGTLGTVALGAAPGGLAAQTGTKIAATTALKQAGVLGRVGFGGAVGALTGGGEALRADKSSQDIFKETAKGATIGVVISGALEGVGALLRRYASAKGANISGRIMDKELRPSTKDVAQDLKRNLDTIGRRIVAENDDTGRQLYKGTLAQMRSTATKQLGVVGGQLDDELAKIPGKVPGSGRNQVKQSIIDSLEETFGELSEAELKTVEKQVVKLPDTLTLTQALEQRRLFDKKIPASFWIDQNPRASWGTQTSYEIRSYLRRLMEDTAPEGVVRELNRKLGLAIDVRELSAMFEASKRLGRSHTFGFIRPFLERTIFNPAVTTRLGAAARDIGKAGQTQLRQTARTAATQALTDTSQ